MAEQVSRWIMQAAYLLSGVLYVRSIEARPGSRKKTAAMLLGMIVFFGVLNRHYVYIDFRVEMAARMLGFVLLGIMNYVGHMLSFFAAFYYAIWAFRSEERRVGKECL